MAVSNSITNSNSIFSLKIAFSQKKKNKKKSKKMPISKENPSLSITFEAPQIWPVHCWHISACFLPLFFLLSPILTYLLFLKHNHAPMLVPQGLSFWKILSQSHMAFFFLLGLDSGITWAEAPPLGSLSKQDALVPSDAWPSLLSHHFTPHPLVPCLSACLISIEYLPH